jgi:hypothetical protein
MRKQKFKSRLRITSRGEEINTKLGSISIGALVDDSLSICLAASSFFDLHYSAFRGTFVEGVEGVERKKRCSERCV